MHSFEELRGEFTDYLEGYNFPQQPAALYNACRHILSIGGKRVRPVLCLMAADAYGTEDDQVMKAALAVELFHNFSLVHDDIMDKADIRRGQPTVHKKFCQSTAILSGDVLNVYAYQLLNDLESENKKAIIDLFNKTAIEVCEGQQMDMDFEDRTEVDIDEYIEMISLKTSVLLACSLEIGALLSSAPKTDADLLYEFGKNVGVAFQLKDDYLDSYGEQSKTGKKVGGDILANKKTIFYCYCMQQASVEQKEELMQLQQSNDEGKVANILAFYQSFGAKEYVQNLKQEYSQKAFTALEEVELADDRKEALRNLATYLLERQH